MGMEIKGYQSVNAVLARTNMAQPVFSGQKAEQGGRKRPDITLTGLLGGFGKQILKGNFGVIAAFLSYQKDLAAMKTVLKKVDFRVEPGGATPTPSNVELNNASMQEFAGALRGGAEGLLGLFAAQGMNSNQVSFKEGFLQTLKNFGTPVADGETERRYFLQPGNGPEVPLYAKALDELEARCKAQGITPVRGTLEEAFAEMRKAAMPSGKLADAVAIMKDVESRF